MIKSEWITRCAARYVERTGLTQDQAADTARICFDEQEGEF